MLYYIEIDPDAKISDLAALEAALDAQNAVIMYGEMDGPLGEPEPDTFPTAFKVGDKVRLGRVPKAVVEDFGISNILGREFEVTSLGHDLCWSTSNLRVADTEYGNHYVLPVEYLVKCSS